MNKKIKHQYKDRVFQDLFSDPKNQLDLYKSLHPEDTTVNENDIKQITLHPIFVNDIYNDLGLLVNNSLMMFIEAQSTWSVNILVRLLIYLGQSLQQYIEYKKIEPYTSTPMPLPNIEFYVIYTGDKEHVPAG